MLPMTERTIAEAHIATQKAELSALKERALRLEISIDAAEKLLSLMNNVTTASAEVVLKSGSRADETYRVLFDAGEPLHVGEIIRRMEREDTPGNRNSLVGMLSRHIRRGQIFARTGPNTFGLLADDGDTEPHGDGDERDPHKPSGATTLPASNTRPTVHG